MPTNAQGQFHGGEHGLLVVMQHLGEDIDHLAITAETSQHLVLKMPE